jgi:hypothetical protein
VAATLALALAVTFCGNCVPVLAATAAQRLLQPPAMDPDCPMTEKHRCCVSDIERVQEGLVSKPYVLTAPSLDVFVVLPFEQPDHLVYQRQPSGAQPIPKLESNIPRYVLSSTFRI